MTTDKTETTLELFQRDATQDAIHQAGERLRIGANSTISSFEPDTADIAEGLVSTYKFLLSTCERQHIDVRHELIERDGSGDLERVDIICTRKP